MSDWQIVGTRPAGNPAPGGGYQVVGTSPDWPVTQALRKFTNAIDVSHGINQGVNDVVRSTVDPVASWVEKHVPGVAAVDTLGGMLPSRQDAAARHQAEASQMAAQNKQYPMAPFGRVVGQVAASAPIMAAVGEAAAPLKAAPVIGRAAQFAAGQGGLASRVVSGALQGATGAALTNKASDAPLGEQMASGAVLGGALPLLAQGVVSAGKGIGGFLTGGTDDAGRTLADRVQMFDQAGVTPTLAATGGKGTAAIAKVAAENPIAGVPARGRMAQSLAQTAQAANDLAARYGDALPSSTMGEQVQAGVTKYARGAGDMIAPGVARLTPSRVTTFGDKANALYTRAEGLVGNTAAPIDLSNTRNAIAQVQGAFADPNLAQRFGNPTLNGIASDIDQAGGKLSWNDAKMLRTNIRERLMSDPALRGTINDAQVNGIYGALTDDLQNGAEQLGGAPAAKAWQQANQFYRAGQARLNDQLQRVFNAPSGENAYDQIIKAAGSTATADVRKLSALKGSLPADTWGDVASTAIKRMGTPSPGSPAAADPNAFSVNNFVTNYSKLSPMGREVLFGGNLPVTRAADGTQTSLKGALDNLAQVAGLQKGVEAAANHSNTAVAAQTGAMIGGLVNPHTMGPTLGAIGGLAVSGEAMTNPSFVRWLAGFAKTGATPGATASLKALALADPHLMPVYVDVARGLLPSGEQRVAAQAQPVSTDAQ